MSNTNIFILVCGVFALVCAYGVLNGAAFDDTRQHLRRIELKLQQIEEAQQACGLGREDI